LVWPQLFHLGTVQCHKQHDFRLRISQPEITSMLPHKRIRWWQNHEVFDCWLVKVIWQWCSEAQRWLRRFWKCGRRPHFTREPLRQRSKETHLNWLPEGSVYPGPSIVWLEYASCCIAQDEHVPPVVSLQRAQADATPFRFLSIGQLGNGDDVPKVSYLWWRFLEYILELPHDSHYCLS
jgi:hypothetical protein